MLHRSLFKTLIQFDGSKKQINCYGRNVIDFPELLNEMYYRQMLLNQHFISLDAENGIKWLLGFSNYINQNSLSKVNVTLVSRKYKFGEIIDVDFFGGFTNELTYDHPAVVLKDVGGGLFIAPITSNKDIFINAASIKTHIKLSKDALPYGYMKKNSTIKLEQARYISKARVLRLKSREKFNPVTGIKKTIYQKITDSIKVKEIKLALAMFLSSDVIYELEQKKEQLEINNISLIESEKNMMQSIFDKDEKIMELERHITELKSKLGVLEGSV